MENVRELVGALTQARVQMLAAQAVIQDEEGETDDDAERSALALDAQKLKRCMGVICDVRDRYARPGIREVPPAKDGGE